MFTVKETTSAALIALRWQVLRPGRPESTAHFPGDDLPTTVHFAAFSLENRVIGCATVLETEGRLQLRGMATDPQRQGTGVGKAVLEAVQAHARKRGLDLWCNARISAQGFYERLGWQPEGEIFDVPDVGPHVRMRYRPSLS